MYEDALECYNTIDKYGTISASMTDRGSVLEKLGRYEDAVQCYDIEMERRGIEPEVLLRKACLLHHVGAHEKSRECFDGVQNVLPGMYSVDPEHPLYLKGLFLAKMGKYEDAAECYDRVLEEGTVALKAVDILAAKGDALARFGRYEDAIRCYDTAIRMDQDAGPLLCSCCDHAYDRIDALSRKISALYCLGRYDEVIECYDMIIDVDTNPNSDRANQCRVDRNVVAFAKVLFLDEIGRHKEAVRWYNEYRLGS